MILAHILLCFTVGDSRYHYELFQMKEQMFNSVETWWEDYEISDREFERSSYLKVDLNTTKLVEFVDDLGWSDERKNKCFKIVDRLIDESVEKELKQLTRQVYSDATDLRDTFYYGDYDWSEPIDAYCGQG